MSKTNCKWLPNTMPRYLNETEPEYLARLYQVFERDFKKTQPLFKGYRVGCRKNPITHGYEEGFYHLTSYDYYDTGFENRILDEQRSARLPWIRPVIENYGCKDVCCNRLIIWKEKQRWRLLFPDERYIVVLDERKGYFVVVTAYYIDKEHEHELQRYLRQHGV